MRLRGGAHGCRRCAGCGEGVVAEFAQNVVGAAAELAWGRQRQARLWSSRSHAELCESASSPMREPALKAILELVSTLEALPR